MTKMLSLSKMRRMLWMMGKFKIPLIAFVRPKLIKIEENQTEVSIRLRRRTKNHLNSMYFGALAVGADVTAGLHSFYFAALEEKQISFAFKAIKAEFIQRATSDVTFISREGAIVRKVFETAKESGERINEWIQVEAKNTSGELVAKFVMEISVRVK